METLPFLDSLRTRLIDQGLPRNYVDRTVLELEDHFEDLLRFSSQSPEQLARCLDRFGTIDQLTQRLVSEYRQQSFAGRHPGLIFGLLPIPLSFLGAALFYLVSVAMIPQAFLWLTRNGWLIPHTPEAQLLGNLSAGLLNTIGEVVVPIACALLLFRLAYRGGWMKGWIWLSSGLVAVFCLASTITLRIQSVESELGRNMQLSLQMSTPQSLSDFAIQALQATLPMLVVLVCLGLNHWPRMPHSAGTIDAD
ncbi:hypothetical protein AB1L30_11350 [Bremerella sp. JC817]|uniref:hypothetical protein n=1 Tax=Bremerella sp. JC817 TaxID=3231756 RepID=UPI00345A92A8